MNRKHTPIWVKLSLTIAVAMTGLGTSAETFELRMAHEAVPGARDIERGNVEQGIRRLEHAHKRSRAVARGAIATDLCAAFIMQREWQPAEVWCDRAVHESSHNADGAAHNNRGVLRTIQGEYGAAVEDFTQAAKLRNYKVGESSALASRAMAYRQVSRQIAARNREIAEERWAAASQQSEPQRVATK